MKAALLFEWRRITSIRSSYVLAGLFLVASAIVAYLTSQAMGFDPETGELMPMSIPFGTLVTVGTNYISAIFVTTIAAQAFGHEYRYGTIRLTLSEFPRRWVVFVAKAVVVAAWVLVLFALSVLVAWLTLRITGADVEPTTGDTWWQVVRSGLYLLGYCLIAFTITVLTRNLVLGVVVPLLMGAVIEQLVALGLSGRFEWVPDYLPISSGNRFAVGDPSMVSSGLVYLAWVVVLVVASVVMLERRDA